MDKKILVVDDEKPIADILQFNLEKEGFTVMCAYDGINALEKVEKEKPDVRRCSTGGVVQPTSVTIAIVAMIKKNRIDLTVR